MFGTDEEKCRFTKTVVTMFVVLSTFHINAHLKKKNKLIHILIWTPEHFEPFNFIDLGQKGFKNCFYKNCFLTGNHSYLKDIKHFDVIMFNVVNLDINTSTTVPPERSPEQKYCFFGVEPAAHYPISDVWNGFFNFTFTYKLSSSVTIPYVVIQDERDQVIGPRIHMEWMMLSEMNETSDFVKNKLRNKHIAAAWFVSFCDTPWRRIYAKMLQKELSQYGHTLDIYGKCGTKECPRGSYGVFGNNSNITCPQNERMDECLALLESDYYFYLSFENSFAEDYVTEKVLHALQHFTVPIVLGTADYSRFMPDGIYLNTNFLTPDKMAQRMNEIISDTNKYYEFFKWYDHYSFQFSGDTRYTREICRLCAYLNNNKKKISVFDNIVHWWNAGWPPWPIEEYIEEQNNVERFLTKMLNFLDPSD